MTDPDDYGGARPPTFSQRYGYEDYPTEIQYEDLDDRIRTDLWNYIYGAYINTRYGVEPLAVERIWTEFYARPANHLRNFGELFTEMEQTVRAREWNKVYDLVQFLVQASQRGWSIANDFNRILTRNRAGWRIVDDHLVPITNDAELQSISEAIGAAMTPAATHIKNALSLMANRENPNYAKSIQESILAVEAAAQDLAGVKKPLGDALETARRNGDLDDVHPALIAGWKSIYGFTSQSGGIRHAAHEGTVQPTPEHAQYFLVSCSAFVNLLTSQKAS
ncbi:AbiJ-NTD4 domain-containing protein [Mycolicibacterium sp. XJ879]